MTDPPARDFPSLLSRLAQHGQRAALSFYRGKALEGRLSYEELAARVEALAGGLHFELGVGAGDRGAILSPNRMGVPVLARGLLRLCAGGGALNPRLAARGWAFVGRPPCAAGLCGAR